jgi:hypothetical protein
MITIEAKNTGIKNMAEFAKTKAIQEKDTIEFVFNNVTCRIGSSTNINWFVRDYFNGLNMGWDVIGPDCVKLYDEETSAAIEAKNEQIKQDEDNSIL